MIRAVEEIRQQFPRETFLIFTQYSETREFLWEEMSKLPCIDPNSGYAVKDVVVDGKSVGAVTTYTFSKVDANHTIAATFVEAK